MEEVFRLQSIAPFPKVDQNDSPSLSATCKHAFQMKIKRELLKEDLELAKQLATEVCGSDDSAIIGAVMNAITAQRLGGEIDTSLDILSSKICEAAAVAAGG